MLNFRKKYERIYISANTDMHITRILYPNLRYPILDMSYNIGPISTFDDFDIISEQPILILVPI